MRKVDGVDTVDISLKNGLTVLELRPGNRVTLAQLRTVIKNNGFVSKDAVIVAAGDVKGDVFQVSGSGELLAVAFKPASERNELWRFTSPVK